MGDWWLETQVRIAWWLIEHTPLPGWLWHRIMLWEAHLWATAHRRAMLKRYGTETPEFLAKR